MKCPFCGKEINTGYNINAKLVCGECYDKVVPVTKRDSYSACKYVIAAMNKKKKKLQEKLSKLNDRLYQVKLDENQKINNMGWGTGMRCTKVSISFRRSDALKEKIEEVTNQLELLT